MTRLLACTMLCFWLLSPSLAASYEYRILSTFRASTMEKEMNEAADAGFVFAELMTGEPAVRQDEVLVIMQRDTTAASTPKRTYKVLATGRTSTMEKEMQQLGEDGFEYKAQTEFKASSIGRELSVIMERDLTAPSRKIEYRLLSTARKSTMQKELNQAGDAGFRLAGVTSAKAFIGEQEICILRKD